MFEHHPCFSTPSGETVIWRFMDLTRFLSLLVRKSLFFCQADKLEDPYEGEWPEGMAVAYREMLRSLLPPEQASAITRHLQGSRFFNKTTVFMNCWHVNPNESAAMWKLYATNHEGIGIKSTVKRLCDSMKGWPRRILSAR